MNCGLDRVGARIVSINSQTKSISFGLLFFKPIPNHTTKKLNPTKPHF